MKKIIIKYICIGLVLCLLITSNEDMARAITLNSYDYLARNLVLPDLITRTEAKNNGNIKRLPDEENEYTFVFENMDGTITSYSYQQKVQTKNSNGSLSDIDLDLKLEPKIEKRIGKYKQTGNNHELIVPEKLGFDEQIKIVSNDYEISMSPVDKENKKLSSEIGKIKKVKRL